MPGTHIYHHDSVGIDAVSGADRSMLRTKVINGPACIRGGPVPAHSQPGSCEHGIPLTIWTPATDDWLRASCYRAIGWIHESLLQIDDQ